MKRKMVVWVRGKDVSGKFVIPFMTDIANAYQHFENEYPRPPKDEVIHKATLEYEDKIPWRSNTARSAVTKRRKSSTSTKASRGRS